jgi:hypothetical protein
MAKQWRDLAFIDGYNGEHIQRARVDIPPGYILFIYPTNADRKTFRMYLDHRAPMSTVWEKQDVELIFAAVLLQELQKNPKHFDFRFNPEMETANVRRLYELHQP